MRTDDQFALHIRVLRPQFLNDTNGGVSLVGYREDDLIVGVIL